LHGSEQFHGLCQSLKPFVDIHLPSSDSDAPYAQAANTRY
jgi:hypothetical protein